MFEYFFSLTKADGDIIDVIAGQSGFLPGGHAQTASSDVQKKVTLARPDNLKPAGAPDHYDIGPWLPACVSPSCTSIRWCSRLMVRWIG
jgi:hypothetical protein